jgi:tetratricopeptide (TPR) repeat protein
MDDIYFRLGYCLCQKGQWQDALTCFESLFEKFPQSPLAGKTACLYYVAAAHCYGENPEESMYTRYIQATKTFLKYCPDSANKSEAHFQLGKYYQNTKKVKESLGEFSLVEKDSPNYVQAKYYAAKTVIDTLQSLYEKGMRQSEEARKLYQDALGQLAGCQSLLTKGEVGTDRKELEAHMAILLARLHIYGPKGAWKEALQLLTGFERQAASVKNSEQLSLMAKSLRMECYLQLHMFREAEEEITSFLKEGYSEMKRWTFLSEAASRFFHNAKTMHSKNSTVARSSAHIALLLYERLFSIALQNTSYKQFSDSIQFRMAELYLDENQMEKAKMIYQEKLKNDPSSAVSIYNLGLIYEKEGQWQEALDMWKRYTQGLKTDSYEWFEARYRTANVLNQLGKVDEACEIITMTQVLHPALQDETVKGKFMQLQKEVCRKN